VQQSTYPGSIVDAEGGAEADVNHRIGKAQQPFYSMKKIWKYNILSFVTVLGVEGTFSI
jgi:hypothetical protein